MLGKFWIKIVAFFGVFAGLVASLKFKEKKDVEEGEQNVRTEQLEQLVVDIQVKNKIEEQVNESIKSDSIDERVDELLHPEKY